MSALNTQVGGDHYKRYPIQPAEYIIKNGLGFAEGCVVKYVTRWRDKNGVEDLKKARHFLDLLIELSSPEPTEDVPCIMANTDTTETAPTKNKVGKMSTAEYERLAMEYAHSGAIAFVVSDVDNQDIGFATDRELLAYLRNYDGLLTVLSSDSSYIYEKMAGNRYNKVFKLNWSAGGYQAMRLLPHPDRTNGS